MELEKQMVSELKEMGWGMWQNYMEGITVTSCEEILQRERERGQVVGNVLG